MITSQEQRDLEYRVNLRRQADFLRALAGSVYTYNASHDPKIDMAWLFNEIMEAAEECDLEAENQEV